jgi:hypothetical protein
MNLGQSKVSELDMAMTIKQHILWFHIPVDDVMRVKMIQSHSKLRGVESHHTLREPEQRKGVR